MESFLARVIVCCLFLTGGAVLVSVVDKNRVHLREAGPGLRPTVEASQEVQVSRTGTQT